MNAISHRRQIVETRDWLPRTRTEAYRKIESSPLVQGCAGGGKYPRVLCGEFWYFVNAFPEIIRETYAAAPATVANGPLAHFLNRAAAVLSGTLSGIEGDERTHRALWIRASGRVGLSETQLHRWRVLAEIRSLTDAIRDERQLGRRLLYFVAVEMVAESLSRYLSGEPRFVEAMGEEGMLWFAAHRAAPDHASSHEALAFELAMSVKRAANEPIDELSVNADIQRCVDWFVTAGAACVREFAVPGDGS